MTENAWLIIAVIGYSLAGVGLISTALIYFKLDIPDVIGDLSGRTVARALKAMRDNGLPERTAKHKQVASFAPAGTKSNTPKARNLAADKSAMSYAHESKRLDKAGVSTDNTGKTGRTAGTTGRTAGTTGRTAGATGRTAGTTGRTAGTTGRTAGMTGRMGADNVSRISRGRATENLSTDTEVLECADTDVLNEYDTAVLAGDETSVLPELYSEEKQTKVSLPTEKLSDATERLDAEEEYHAPKTSVLSDASKTAVLSDDSAPVTIVLTEDRDAGATQVLAEDKLGGTTVLGTEVLTEETKYVKPVLFSVIRNYSVTHTDEVIKKP